MMTVRNTVMLGFALFTLQAACDSESSDSDVVTTPVGTTFIKPTEQRTGESQQGYNYLVYGDYVSSGIPYEIYLNFSSALPYEVSGGGDNINLLNREGDNALVPYSMNAVEHANGEKIVVPNCLSCHAQVLNGELVIGLGNSTLDLTVDQTPLIELLNGYMENTYGKDSPQWLAYDAFQKTTLAVAPSLVVSMRGVNAADMLGAVLAAYRSPSDLTWNSEPLLPMPTSEHIVGTDVPAWWLLKKKNAMFYAGVGRGDFTKFLMASSLLTMKDVNEAEKVDAHFGDVLAYIYSLEPPVYPEPINRELALQGESIFQQNCARCHGTYGENETYPNLLVDVDTVQTDPVLAKSNFSAGQFMEWYNSSWFGQNGGELVVGTGYIAPPLDGVWATAPYLHNGSIPTLASLLNSSERPAYWRRQFQADTYDYQRVGWPYSVEASQVDKKTYDTTLRGYSNQGHTFGDVLSSEDRGALLEYLKTL